MEKKVKKPEKIKKSPFLKNSKILPKKTNSKKLPKLDVSLNYLNELLEELRPYIAMDGGDMEVVKVEGLVVFVKLYGACVGCGSAPITLQYGVENLFKEKVHPDIEVVPMYDEED